jgi:hypothetical protein
MPVIAEQEQFDSLGGGRGLPLLFSWQIAGGRTALLRAILRLLN